MKIDSLKDLKSVLQLCQRLGVTDIKIDGIEAKITKVEKKPTKSVLEGLELPPEAYASVPRYDASSPLLPDNDEIKTDGLSEEELLMWSVQQEPQ